MLTLLKNIPLPIVGVMLGVAALAKLHLLLDFHTTGNIFFVLALIMLAIVLAKMIFTPKNVLVHLENPIIASVFPTLFLGSLILLSIVRIEWLWWLVAGAQILYAVFFTYKFAWKPRAKVDQIFPSWFVVYVGLGMVPITAGDFSSTYATIIWFVAVIALIVLFPIVAYRIFVKRNIPEPAKPLMTILAAPASICVMGYLQHFDPINESFLIGFECFAQLVYFVVLVLVVKMLRLPFYPSYGAFTFPLVASAMSLTNVYFLLGESAMLRPIVYVEMAIATAIVVYVCIRYMMYMLKTNA